MYSINPKLKIGDKTYKELVKKGWTGEEALAEIKKREQETKKRQTLEQKLRDADFIKSLGLHNQESAEEIIKILKKINNNMKNLISKIVKLLHHISNLFLTSAVYLYKYTKPKKEKYKHDILVIPPRFFDYGAENICRDYDLQKSKKLISELEKQSNICYNETF